LLANDKNNRGYFQRIDDARVLNDRAVYNVGFQAPS
jgi:hypothetical protein